MTAKLSLSPCQPTAHGRSRIFALTTAVVLAISAGLASASRADTGSVYFDGNGNAAAGQALFNGSFTGGQNVGSASVMPNLTTVLQPRRWRRRSAIHHRRHAERRRGRRGAVQQHHRRRRRRRRRRRAGRQHDRRRQRRHRRLRADLQHDRLQQRRHR